MLVRVPQIGADQRLAAVEIDLFGGDENPAAWDFAINCQWIEKLRVGGNPRASIDAQGFIDARHKKDQADARSLYEVAERIDPVVAESVGSGSVASSITRTKPGASPLGGRRNGRPGDDHKW